MQIKFLVQYPSKVSYQVTFIEERNEFSAFCTCIAGNSGQCCQHRIAILEGSKEYIRRGNLDDVDIIQSWLPGTAIESALHDLKKAREVGVEIDISAAKNRLAEVMHDTWTV